jgi:hypothetical protein
LRQPFALVTRAQLGLQEVREGNRDQDEDNGDHDEELDQGKTTPGE